MMRLLRGCCDSGQRKTPGNPEGPPARCFHRCAVASVPGHRCDQQFVAPTALSNEALQRAGPILRSEPV